MGINPAEPPQLSPMGATPAPWPQEKAKASREGNAIGVLSPPWGLCEPSLGSVPALPYLGWAVQGHSELGWVSLNCAGPF